VNTENAQAVKTGIQFASEVVFPGGSNAVNGDFKTAGIHAAAGLAAKALFGIPGLLVVSANSFSKAVTGQNLIDLMKTIPPVKLNQPSVETVPPPQ
jgi:hypothetical protein